MRVLGIDPGYARCGFGVVESEGSRLKALDYGVFETAAGTPFEERLLYIADGVDKLVEHFRPEVMAVEELFFARNTTTAMGTAQARGVIMLSAARHEIPVYEYKPAQVKLSVTGYGRADKKQVQEMIKILLNLQQIPDLDDAADALAVAVCQAHHGKLGQRLKGGYQ